MASRQEIVARFGRSCRLVWKHLWPLSWRALSAPVAASFLREPKRAAFFLLLIELSHEDSASHSGGGVGWLRLSLELHQGLFRSEELGPRQENGSRKFALLQHSQVLAILRRSSLDPLRIARWLLPLFEALFSRVEPTFPHFSLNIRHRTPTGGTDPHIGSIAYLSLYKSLSSL